MSDNILESKMRELGVGVHSCSTGKLFSFMKVHGYVDITDEDDGGITVMWMSGKDTHNPRDGAAYSITFDADGKMTFCAKHVYISWFSVDDEDKKRRIELIMLARVDRAIKYRNKRNKK